MTGQARRRSEVDHVRWALAQIDGIVEVHSQAGWADDDLRRRPARSSTLA